MSWPEGCQSKCANFDPFCFLDICKMKRQWMDQVYNLDSESIREAGFRYWLNALVAFGSEAHNWFFAATNHEVILVPRTDWGGAQLKWLVGWFVCLVGNATEVKVPLELTSGLGSFIGFRHRGSRILRTSFSWHPWVRFDHGPCDRRAFNMVRATGQD